VPGTAERDLASAELWRESLVRSQRRRVLAAEARKDQARKKTAASAVTAAVAAAPMWPSLTASASDLSTQDAGKLAQQLKHNHAERILLSYGDQSSAVAEAQRALGIADDGMYGPQTRAAVKAFQKKHDLLATGKIDVKTWLKLFPTDMIIYAPPGSASALGVNDTSHPEWAAVSTDPSSDHGSPAVAKVAHAAAAKAKLNGAKHDPGSPSVHAASIGATGPAPVIGPNGGGSGSGSPMIPGVLGGVVAPNGGGGGGGGWTPHFPPLSQFGSAAEMIRAMIRMANKIDSHHYAYRWGGGHNASFSGPYDCSGAVSAVLHAAGLLSAPRVSGGFMHWGAPGRGAVTLYANAGHVYMSILGHFFGTSGANPGGGAGWFNGGPRPGFAVVHVPFSALHFKSHKKHKRHHKRHRRRAARKHTAQQQGPLNKPATTPPPSQTGGSQAPSSSSPPASSSPPTTTTASTGTAPAQGAPAGQPAAATPNAPVTPAPAPTPTPQAQSAPVAAAPATPNVPAAPQATPPAGSGGPVGGTTPNGPAPNPAPATPPASNPGMGSGTVTPAPQAPKPAVVAPKPQVPAAPAPTPNATVPQTAEHAEQGPQGPATQPPKPPAGGGGSGQGATPNGSGK